MEATSGSKTRYITMSKAPPRPANTPMRGFDKQLEVKIKNSILITQNKIIQR